MDCRMSWIYVLERSGREHESFLVKDFDRRRRRPTGWKADDFSKACAHELSQNRALVPPFKGRTSHFCIINFDAFLDPLSNILEEELFRLQLIENSIDKVHA